MKYVIIFLSRIQHEEQSFPCLESHGNLVHFVLVLPLVLGPTWSLSREGTSATCSAVSIGPTKKILLGHLKCQTLSCHLRLHCLNEGQTKLKPAQLKAQFVLSCHSWQPQKRSMISHTLFLCVRMLEQLTHFPRGDCVCCCHKWSEAIWNSPAYNVHRLHIDRHRETESTWWKMGWKGIYAMGGVAIMMENMVNHTHFPSLYGVNWINYWAETMFPLLEPTWCRGRGCFPAL